MVHSTGSFFSSVIHQSVSRRGPIICHLKLLKIDWTFLNAVLLLQKKGKHLFMTFYLPPCPLCPGQAMWFLAPLLIPRIFSVPVVPSISFPCGSFQCGCLCVSIKGRERYGAWKRAQSSTILITPASKCVKRACTKAIWWEKKNVKSWSKFRGCFLQRRSQDLESIPQKETLRVDWSSSLPQRKNARPDLDSPSWALLICLQLAQLWEGPGGPK